MPNLINLKGTTKGLWTIGRRVHTSRKKPMWSCVCECGTKRLVSSDSLLSGKSISCGCQNPGVRGLPYGAAYNSLKRSCLKRGYKLELRYDEFLQIVETGACHYCGEPLSWSEYVHKASGSRAYQIDRKDNSLGYTKDNCVSCCKRCNWGKGDQFRYDEWKQIGDVIRTWKK